MFGPLFSDSPYSGDWLVRDLWFLTRTAAAPRLVLGYPLVVVSSTEDRMTVIGLCFWSASFDTSGVDVVLPAGRSQHQHRAHRLGFTWRRDGLAQHPHSTT